MKLSNADRVALARHFAHTFNGTRTFSREVHTNAGHIDLARLHSLTRKGAITYEDDPMVRQCFGVRGWIVKLTDAGWAALQEED